MRRGMIYLAGPMTGHPEYNYPAFDKVAKELEGKGWIVLNPADSYSRNTRLPYKMYMRAAINLLLQANGLALMDGWRKSRGARMETLLAQRLDLPIYNAHTGHRMRVAPLLTTRPIITRSGISPYSREMVRRLVPLARRMAKGNRDGITMIEVRREALRLGLLHGDETKGELSGLGPVMPRAGLVHVRTTRRSDLDVAHGSYQTVWFEDLSAPTAD